MPSREPEPGYQRQRSPTGPLVLKVLRIVATALGDRGSRCGRDRIGDPMPVLVWGLDEIHRAVRRRSG